MNFIRKHKTLTLSILSLFLGIGIGITLLFATSENVHTKIVEIISPIQNVFINIICYLALPVFFIFIVTSIFEIRNFKTFGKISIRIIIQFIVMMIVCSFVAGLISSLIFGLKFGNANSNLSGPLSLLASIFPQDIWTPFINKNILQINLMATIFGITLLIIGKEASWFVDLLKRLNKILLKIFSFIAIFVPLYILISIAKIILIKDSLIVVNLWKLILVYLSLLILLTGVYFVRTLIISKNRKILLHSLPPFLIALTSANSTLSLHKNIDVSINKLNEKEKFAGFSIPFAMVLYKPAGTIYLSVIATYFAMINGANISLTWLLSLAIITTILNIAIPPVNGGGINNYSILLKELSLPLTPLPILIVLDSVMEFIITGFNVYSQTLETYCIARTSKNIKGEMYEATNIS